MTVPRAAAARSSCHRRNRRLARGAALNLKGRTMDRIHRTLAAIAALASLTGLPADGAQPVTSNAFNPAISLILDMRLASSSADPEEYEIPGFQLGGEAGPSPRGFSLGESELVVSSNIDDWFYGTLVAALHEEEGETAIELEEAWIQTQALPSGFTLKAGKMFSRLGYQNEKHPHAWDFVDAPLVYDAFLGGNLKDTGVQARWVAPTALYLELGVEAFAGESFPAAGRASGGKGMYSAFAKLGGDWDDSNSWQVGISGLDAQAVGREAGGHHDDGAGTEPEVAFTGDSELVGVDFVWKWAPNGNFKQEYFTLAGEWLRREESGDLEVVFPPATLPEAGTYSGTQDGYYLQGVYKWRPQWRVGLRYDRLSADNAVAGLSAPIELEEDGQALDRLTLMVDYSRSEFSRFRLQLARDESTGSADHQVVLQYIVSMGAHGAHQY